MGDMGEWQMDCGLADSHMRRALIPSSLQAGCGSQALEQSSRPLREPSEVFRRDAGSSSRQS